MILSRHSSLIQFKHIVKKTRFNVVFLMFSMSLCFAFILSALQITHYYDNLINQQLNTIHVAIFLNNDATAQDIKELKTQLEKSPSITSLRLISKEEALDSLKKDNNFTDILSRLKNNPLPNAFVIQLKTTSSEAIVQELEHWKTLRFIRKINVDLPWVERTLNMKRFLQRLSTLFIGVMSLLILVLSVNSIRHYVLTSRTEHFVALCLGATHRQLLLPIIEIVCIESLLIVSVGSLLSLIFLTAFNRGLNSLFVIAGSAHNIPLMNVPTIALVIALFVGGNIILAWLITRLNYSTRHTIKTH